MEIYCIVVLLVTRDHHACFVHSPDELLRRAKNLEL